MRTRWVSLILVLALSAAGVATEAEAAEKLGRELTPLGAVKAGNASGDIPAWEGGLTKPPAGYAPGKHHPDPFPDDKPLFTITAANVEQYKAHLSPGHIALFRRYPKTFRMPVYRTRRTAALPQRIYDKTIANALEGSLESKAWSGIGLVLGMLDNDRIGTLEQVRGELADDATWSSG